MSTRGFGVGEGRGRSCTSSWRLTKSLALLEYSPGHVFNNPRAAPVNAHDLRWGDKSLFCCSWDMAMVVAVAGRCCSERQRVSFRRPRSASFMPFFNAH